MSNFATKNVAGAVKVTTDVLNKLKLALSIDKGIANLLVVKGFTTYQLAGNVYPMYHRGENRNSGLCFYGTDSDNYAASFENKLTHSTSDNSDCEYLLLNIVLPDGKVISGEDFLLGKGVEKILNYSTIREAVSIGDTVKWMYGFVDSNYKMINSKLTAVFDPTLVDGVIVDCIVTEYNENGTSAAFYTQKARLTKAQSVAANVDGDILSSVPKIC